MRKIKLTLITVLCMLLLAGIAGAEDYVAPPGVLSPEEVDFGGATVTIIRGALPNR